MPYIGNEVGNRFVASKAASVYSGNGSTTAFTLEHAVGSDEDILVSVDGVIQEPSVAYAVSSGTTLTFTAAPSSNSGNNIFVYYLFRTVATVDHPSTSSLQATDGTFSSTLNVTGVLTGTSLDISGDIDVDGTTNLDVVDIDGAVDMASTLTVGGLATLNGNLSVIGTADSTVNITAGGTSNDSLINFVHGSTTDGGITYDHNGAYASEQMKFRTGNNTSNMTLSGAGALTVANGVTLTDGNLVVASGHGIDFSATSGSASGSASALLDDYEEGTWTPSVGGNATYHNQAGNYVKIGKIVHASAIIQPNSLGTGSTTTVSGLPFTTSNNGGTSTMGGDVGFYYLLALSVMSLDVQLSTGVTTVNFSGRSSAGNTSSTSIALFGDGARVDFSVTYEVS